MDDEDGVGEYDAADDQIIQGMRARDAASALEDAETALEEAAKHADEEDAERLREIRAELAPMRERYAALGEAL